MSADLKKIKSSSVAFPHPSLAMVEGVIAVGGKLDTSTLYAAYAQGIFPWPQEGYPLLWFCPEKRGVLFLSELHVPRSLSKFLRQHPEIEITLNKSFRQVLEECSKQKRPGQEGTWITPAIKRAYDEFYQEGFALSVEVRVGQVLIGGIYGVLVRGVFSGESMFFKTPNASKIAFWKLAEYLRQEGHSWMDIQMVTPVTETFGGKYISREHYLDLLRLRQREMGYEPLI